MANESIMIVDDNPDNLGVLKQILNREGYRVRTANSGRVALASLDHAGVDLILLDILMPGMDGYELCRLIKSRPDTCDIPAIFISALNEPLDKAQGFAVGGVDYISKPFDELEVQARVRVHLQLHQLQQQLERQNEELERVVAKRTAALREANAGLAKALQARQDFLALVSHELRTPLNVILGMASLLERAPDASQQKRAAMIRSSGWHLLRLINDILTLAQQGETGGAPMVSVDDAPDDAPLDIAKLCATCLKTVQPLADQKGIAIRLNVDGSLPTNLAIPSSRLYQIIGNLMDNAVRFTPEGGQVGIEIRRHWEDKGLFIEVWDTGGGIPDADKPRIFDPFVQLEPVMTRRHGGLGLGLSLAMQFCRLHGGTIGVADRAGGGAIFRVLLPQG